MIERCEYGCSGCRCEKCKASDEECVKKRQEGLDHDKSTDDLPEFISTLDPTKPA